MGSWENWEVIRTQVQKYVPGIGESKKGGSKGDIRRGATDIEAMKKGRSVGIIERKKVRRDDAIEHFLFTKAKLPFKSHMGDVG